MSKKFVELAAVLGNVRLGSDVYSLLLDAPQICREAKPGQFVGVKTGWGQAPFLRRPLSVADAADGRITIIYRAAGVGTSWLAARREGEKVDIMGPLGHGFSLEAKRPLLVGGGIGIAPLISVARSFAGRFGSGIVLAGRNKDEITYWQAMFKDLCHCVYIATDDGSMGIRGNALAVLPQAAEEGGYDCIYACGPPPMLKAIAAFVRQKNIPCQLSLESRMGCGLGACQACSCQGADGKRKRICLNGPVFAAGEVEGL
ncbi:MAG: dihydroorotate dehydrogenase electron transfer subunit [Acidaminococcales bacterium]|nr:dihydroorotate dehydrogenase electron transfer subunit [Acidaminococcales bacterium]MDR3348087.1 dihydroorotate dehydrogenase electron transfer subunit [Acidaminococcales bacterium]